jgi:hypothetical protein
MSKREIENLVRVKIALADKCERLAKLSGSKPKARSLQIRARHHRLQAVVIARKLEPKA